MKMCLIVPALEEENGIRKVIESISDSRIKYIVVLDGFSGDNTVITARGLSNGKFQTGILFQEGSGKGMAFQTFLKKFDLGDFDGYVMLDADYTYDPKEIGKMVGPIIDGEADVVMGDRLSYKNVREAMPISSYVGNILLTMAARILYLKDPKDLCTGYWAFSRKFLRSASVRARGFDLEANLFAEAVNRGFRIKSVPIRYKTRIGKKKLRISHGVTILYRLFYERLFTSG
jgi:glycosyltransferase involved in cell wall biosynthesis